MIRISSTENHVGRMVVRESFKTLFAYLWVLPLARLMIRPTSKLPNVAYSLGLV
jgi:hypothetical protein